MAYTMLAPTPLAVDTPAVLTAWQIRAARAALQWTQADLAAASGVAEITVKKQESGQAKRPAYDTLKRLRDAFEAAGVEFIDEGKSALPGPAGIRLKPGDGA
ncbi:helix-turn-helix domain-containing protein [Azospirillum sp. sgz302134]